MLRLATFGGLVLLQDGEPHTGPASQRRRLALLAIIAAAGKRGASRDKLAGLLWAGSEPDAARHSIYQAMHALRRSLGDGELFLGSATQQLNPELITSDVGDFEEALERGAYERAARLYRGPFLEGFRIDDAREFEEWQETERLRLSREFATALERLAAGATGRGDHLGAVQWWRRLASTEPVSTRAAVGLVEALVTAGDRVGALQFASIHAALVRQHLDTEPDTAVQTWIARLRAGEIGTGIAAAPAIVAHGIPSSPVGGTNPAATAARSAAGAAADRELSELKHALAERYQVHDRIAEGTLLLSFTARDRRDTKAVELHVFNPRIAGLANAERALAALERAAALHEPRIIPIRDCGVLQGVLYFATPPLDGLRLRDRLARERPLALEDALQIAGDLADALAYAHGRGVWHGDLRPKHVLLVQGGTRVASFGVVEALDLAAAGGAGSTAVTIGAPAYLSPEQLAGEMPDNERSDVYSMGCILFEMLAGEPPFAGSNFGAILTRKLTQTAPSVRVTRERVPARLDSLVARCLARLPADRPRTAGEVRDALNALRTEIGTAHEG
jgi:DNA-binding SARP family transcriptional activator